MRAIASVGCVPRTINCRLGKLKIMRKENRRVDSWKRQNKVRGTHPTLATQKKGKKSDFSNLKGKKSDF
ncbi:MAG: hypothetical protein DRR19_06905 [Candidatus Parabeggiatoa sp. nov. 1]|nr:MAG: hypothetical protein DRR19_06905 [Gammaproteobacteria bacterium]